MSGGFLRLKNPACGCAPSALSVRHRREESCDVIHPQAGAKGCADYPFDQYPWESCGLRPASVRRVRSRWSLGSLNGRLSDMRPVARSDHKL